VDPLSRLRGRPRPEDDGLSDAEHLAVLDAADLLDELRPLGYGFSLGPGGALEVRPPAGADKETRTRVASLAGAVVSVLRIEAGATPLPDACPTCGAPVWQYTPDGEPRCERHSRSAVAEARPALADADLERQAQARDAAAPPDGTGAGPAAKR
jgi:uncharacterized Zn finger protein (UPF0148 family)